MKKLLVLTSFLFIFSIKINAFEYLICTPTSSIGSYLYYLDNNGNFYAKVINNNTTILNNLNDYIGIYHELSNIKYQSSIYNNFIDSSTFYNYYANDLSFLNLLYTYSDITVNSFLNYLYNSNTFNENNYIHYENYELLYNSDGLAVESIVNGRWAGLYDGPDQSGYLYDEKGDLKYINGVSTSFFESLFNKLIRKFGINIKSIFIRQIFYPLLILIFACVVLRTVIRLAFQAFLIRFYDKKIGQLEKRREKIENA